MQPLGEIEELYFGAAAARGPRELILYPARRGEPQRIDHLRLLTRARGAAAALAGKIQPGQTYLLIADNDLPTVTAFLGGLLLGAVPVLVSPPLGLGGLDTWTARLHTVAEDMNAVAIVGPGTYLDLLDGRLPRLDTAAFPYTGPARPDVTPGLSHIQLTSGSTGHSKGVRITHANLIANLYHIGWASDVRAEDVVVSWLPLYHDMGLVGVLLFSLYWNLDLALLSPVEFLTRPVRWLEAIAAHKGSLSPAPSFAFPYVAHRLRDTPLDLDLSSWRIAYCGAEPINRSAIQKFTDAFASCRLDPGVILPCYGLAEATLAASFTPWGRGVRTARVSRDALSAGCIEEPAAGADSQELVLLGAPLPEIQLELRDDDGAPTASGRTGTVWLRGPTVTPGYFGNGDISDADGWLDTGDVGCWIDGELALIGRTKDIIIVRGRNHSPVTLEWAAEEVDGVRPGSAAAFSCFDTELGTEAPVLACEVAEQESDWSRGAILRQVEESILRQTSLRPRQVVLLAPGSIPKTTSGKIQRGRTRELYLAGQLGRTS